MIIDEYGNRRFYGVYRGVVVDNNDPLGNGRLKLQVPQVLFDAVTDWAWAKNTLGIHTSPPPVGQGIWVEFEGGDPSFPVWGGIFGDDTSKLSKDSVNLALDDLTDVTVPTPNNGQVLTYNQSTDTWVNVGVPTGTLFPFSTSVAPSGYVICDGTTYNSVANTQYAPLFALIGTTYGGTGATAFKVPDMRSAVSVVPNYIIKL
jgi:hypothetical protein